MKITEYIKENIVFLDGGMGTLLQKEGLMPGELPELWNLEKPDVITRIHQEYFDCGSNIVNTNTFGANILKFQESELEEIVKAAIENVRRAIDNSKTTSPKWVALDIGPTGRMLLPYGDLDFEDAVEIFKTTARLGEKYGADLIFIETMNDSYETKAALLAAKEATSLPVFVSNAYSEDGKLMTGASPQAVIAMLEGMGADAVGLNCSFGPKALMSVCEEYLKYASVPVLFKPNAGLPKAVDGKTVYDVAPDEFAEDVSELIKKGVRIVGGCCGTTPEYIKAVNSLSAELKPVTTEEKEYTVVSSYTNAVEFGNKPVLIGERINPTGKKRFKEALRDNDMGYILKEAISQQEKGASVLDVNVGLPEIDEVEMLKSAVCEIQAICDLPLQIDTSDAVAMETALRRYNGKAMVNSVNGKKESMDAVFPLVKKYGGVVVCLTLDEDGIPPKAEGRVAIAKKIMQEAEKYGIGKKDLIFDPLALTISADNTAGVETLRAVRLITEELGAKTSLGVSNISFGLPRREIINGTFFTMAMTNGLSAAIMNPYSSDMMKAYSAFCSVNGYDVGCEEYIRFASEIVEETVVKETQAKGEIITGKSSLSDAIIKGLKEDSATLCRELLLEREPLSVISEEIIPALDVVGVGFENKTVYLPQLLMSAEAAKSAFEEVKLASSGGQSANKCSVVIATVKGDIHDIGKNILKLLLENYGFDTIDLGRDVSPEAVLEATLDKKAPIVGLSALMTTTVPSMEETIGLLKKNAPWCRVIVGGAVLTKEYADMIGADFYAKDAMEGVRIADEIYKSL